MQSSTFKNIDEVCAILNITSLASPAERANFYVKLGAALDVNETIAQRILITPLIRQYQLAKCQHQYQWTLATKPSVPTSFTLSEWEIVVVAGIVAWISVLFNLSLMVVTFKQIKEYKVCNLLLAFDALCQLFTMSTFLINFLATLLGAISIEFRVCMVALCASVMGMFSSVLTIYFISLERMLLIIAPMRIGQLETPSLVRRLSLVTVVVSTAFGFIMSCSQLLYTKSLNQFNTIYGGRLLCHTGLYITIIDSFANYFLLSCSQLNYILLFGLLLWRYFHGVTDGESVQRVLRAVFILSLVVLLGLLLAVSFKQLNTFFVLLLQWLFRLLGIDRASPNSHYSSLLATMQSFVYLVSILPSTSGAPILFFSSNIPSTVVDNLTHLQSIHFSDIDYRGIEELRINNISLQALRVPLYSSRRDSLCLGALPSSLRSLHISFENASKQRMRDSGLIDELLELIISCCPQLAILMLPKCLMISEQSLAKLARFERLLYVRLSFDPSDANVFGNSLAKIGAQLSALLLDVADSRILQLIAKHCPQLEHCGIGIIDCFSKGELLMSALQSVFLLAHLRSLSIGHLCYYNSDLLSMQILAAINGLNAKGTVEYLHLPQVLPLTVEFVTKLIQFNPRLHKLTCAILHNHTPDELEKLKTLMQNIEGPLELEIFSHCPIAMEFGENSKVQTREHYSPESISQTMLRQFWARVMDSVPDLGNLDN